MSVTCQLGEWLRKCIPKHGEDDAEPQGNGVVLAQCPAATGCASHFVGAMIPGMVSIPPAGTMPLAGEPRPPPICDWVRGLLVVVGMVGVKVTGVAGAHWLFGQEFDVDEREQQDDPQPTAENTNSPATPAVSNSFFIFRSPVSCPPVAKSRRFHTLGPIGTVAARVPGVSAFFPVFASRS
jgi:hypothetical protein